LETIEIHKFQVHPARAQVVLAGSRYEANCLEPHAHLAHLFTGLPKATTADQFEAQLPWNVSAACGA
jgi:hypothetical protein